jgi:hypothetical protein
MNVNMRSMYTDEDSNTILRMWHAIRRRDVTGFCRLTTMQSALWLLFTSRNVA